MSTETAVDHYLDTITEEGLYSSRGNLRFQMETLFAGIDFEKKRVLDIGGGFSLYGFYAAHRGAEHVVCLEPESQGSSSGVIDTFHRLAGLLECGSVDLVPVTIQALDPSGEKFDIVLLHNSVNHLDETACVNLLADFEAREVYTRIFSKIYSLSNRGAKIIVCDCSRYNFFAQLRVRNPFVPTIEWHKHHPPEVWANLLGEVGFVQPKIRWSSPNTLRGMGRLILGNRFASYFMTSHFCLYMSKLP